MGLDYYNGDYVRSGVKLGNASSAANYDGNICQQRFNNTATTAVVSTTQTTWQYTYNDRNYLSKAVIGAYIKKDDELEILSGTDYYPLGAEMPEPKFIAESYRFGFNGKEMDNEVSGTGNKLNFGARIYDARLGRWLSLDEKAKPYQSNYNFAMDNPIIFVDPNRA